MMRENTYLGGEPICAIKRGVSKSIYDEYICITKQNKAITYENLIDQSINQSINYKIKYVGPRSKPVLFCMN